MILGDGGLHFNLPSAAVREGGEKEGRKRREGGGKREKEGEGGEKEGEKRRIKQNKERAEGGRARGRED